MSKESLSFSCRIFAFLTSSTPTTVATTRETATAVSAVRLRLSDGAAGNFAYAKYYLLEGTLEEGMVLRCARRSGQLEGTLLTVPYQRTVMRLSNGQTSCPTVAFPVQADDGGEYYRSHVLAMMKEPLFSSKSVYLRSVRDKQSGAWRVLTAFETGTALETGRQEIRLEEIDELLLYYNALLPTYSQSGRLLPWHGWRASALSSNDCLSMTDTCTLLEAPLEEEDGGPYWLQIIIVNADNRQYSAALLPL